MAGPEINAFSSRKDNQPLILTYTNQTHKDLVGKTENYFTNSYPFPVILPSKNPHYTGNQGFN